MLLIAEIVLTVFAWKKGWKWWSLLPAGITLFSSFLLGIILGVSGYSLKEVRPFGILLDILLIIVLIIMVIKPPKNQDQVIA